MAEYEIDYFEIPVPNASSSSEFFTRAFGFGAQSFGDSYVEVRDADYEHGMLTISLQRIVPESLKRRKIAIGSREHVNDDTPQLPEDKAA